MSTHDGEEQPGKPMRRRKAKGSDPSVKPGVSARKPGRIRSRTAHFSASPVGYIIFSAGLIMVIGVFALAYLRFYSADTNTIPQPRTSEEHASFKTDPERRHETETAQKRHDDAAGITGNALTPAQSLNGYWSAYNPPHYAEFYIENGVYQIIYGHDKSRIRRFERGEMKKSGNSFILMPRKDMGKPGQDAGNYIYREFGSGESAINAYFYENQRELVWGKGSYARLPENATAHPIFNYMYSDVVLWSPVPD